MQDDSYNWDRKKSDLNYVQIFLLNLNIHYRTKIFSTLAVSLPIDLSWTVLKTEAARPANTSLSIHQSTRRHIQLPLHMEGRSRDTTLRIFQIFVFSRVRKISKSNS
jgi:hypothetical protein